MGAILRPYLVLLLGQVVQVALQFVQEHGPTLAQQTIDHAVPVSSPGRPWWAVVASAGIGLWTLIKARKLHMAPPPPPLLPTPVDVPDTNRALAQAAGEAFRAASTQSFTPAKPSASEAAPSAPAGEPPPAK